MALLGGAFRAAGQAQRMGPSRDSLDGIFNSLIVIRVPGERHSAWERRNTYLHLQTFLLMNVLSPF